MKHWQTGRGATITRLLQGRSNVYLITLQGHKILVDTGGPNRQRELLNTLTRHNINYLDYLILTHTHFDHAGNANIVRQKYGARVVAHVSERAILEDGISAIPKGTNIFTKAGIALGGKRFAEWSRFTPCPVDIVVTEHFIMPETPGITVLHTSGHSQGSQCVIVDDELALVGDTLFGMFAGGIYPPFADAPQLLSQSWQKLLATPCHTFLPGHGSPRKRAMLQKRAQTLEAVVANKKG